MRVWPEVVDAHMLQLSGSYARVTGTRIESTEVREWWRAYSRYFYCELPAQLVRYRSKSLSQLQRYVRIEGVERLPRVGTGGFVAAASRTGASYLVPWLLASSGYQVVIVTGPTVSLDDVRGTGTVWGVDPSAVTVIPADRYSLLRARRAIANGCVLVIYPESKTPAGSRVAMVPYENLAVTVPLGAARIAALTGSPLVPICGYSDGGSFVIDVHEPLHRAGFPDLTTFNAALFGVLSAWALEHREQWLGWEYLAGSSATFVPPDPQFENARV